MSNYLHDKIMNIPCRPRRGEHPSVIAYKAGHRDARHAAAELALGHATSPVLAAPANSAVLPDQFWELVADCGGTKDLGKNARLLQEWVQAYGQACAAAERERAAKMADSVGHNWSGAPAHAFFDLATAIRART